MTTKVQTQPVAARRKGLGQRRTHVLMQTFAHIVLTVGGLVMIMPFFWLVSSSLKRPETIYVFPPQWIPKPAYWENYVIVFSKAPVLSYIKNTLAIAVLASLGQVLTSALAGYGFARLRFPGRDLIFGLLLSSMMLPYAVTMIPVYVFFSKLRWVNTLYPLIVPFWFGGGAFNIFLLRQFFRTIPWELEEAALLDGASRLKIFGSIILPLAQPALVVVAVFSFRNHWNDFMGPLIYLQKRQMWTLALGVSALKEFESGTDWTHYCLALSAMMVTPIVIMYFLAQRAFVQGIVLTGMKG